MTGQVRGTRGVAVFPVGVLTTEQRVSTPVVHEGRWAGWFEEGATNHKFLTELAAFAVSIQLLLKVGGHPYSKPVAMKLN